MPASFADSGPGAKFSPDQPRVPARNPGGGQWTSGTGDGARDDQNDSDEGRAFELVQNSPRGTQDDGPPLIPKEPPPTQRQRLSIVKELARSIATLAELARAAVDFPTWFLDYSQLLRTALDEPKTLEELQRDVSNPGFGYNIHRIVEQTPARSEGFPEDLIEGADNLVRVPTLKHWEITGWFAMKQDEFGGISPREYLRGRNWEEITEIGRPALIEHGVLKP